MARHVLKRPRDMFTYRHALAIWAAVFALTVAAGAPAQTTTSSLTIVTAGITHTAPRSANRTYEKINRADCEADDVMTFPLTATNFTAYEFQAWVGIQDCTNLLYRTTDGYCSQVLNTTFAQSAGNNSAGATTVPLHVRDLIAAYFKVSNAAGTSLGTGGTSGSGGTDAATAGTGGTTTAGTGGTTTAGTGGTTTVTGSGAEVCDQTATQIAATSLSVWFMLVDPSTGNTVASVNFPGFFKLAGPPPPDTVSAGIGGNLLVVNFSYLSDVSTDMTRNGYNVYCDPPPGKIAADAGLVDDSGVGSAVACPSNLTSSVLIPGENPPTDSKYRCGGSGAITSTTANASNLVDGVPYNVAVAAIDTYENTGTLSTLACQVPQPVTGFYKAYRDAGGQAGGFCSISNKREPILLLAVLGIASCLMLRRRRSA